MPLDYTPVLELNSSKQEWKIRALISRVWDFHPQEKPDFILGMELILVDEKGDRIQASVKTKLVKKFRDQLKEGSFRDIMNFEVLENNGDYRGTTHPYKISLLFNTYLKPSVNIPNVSRFNLCPFGDIESQTEVFIDILGEVVSMSDIKDKIVLGNSPSKLLEIQLSDLNETIIDCTLWGKHAEEVHSFVKSYNNGPIIFLGSLMRTKKYNGKVSVQNSCFSTKLFLNEDIEEIAVYRTKIPEGDRSVSFYATPLKLLSSSKPAVDSFPLHSWETIEKFTSSIEEMTCVTFAEILTFRKELPWYYVGCNNCLGKATPFFNPETEEVEAGKYSCDSCNRQETSTSLRYSVHVKVADHTSTTSFLLFDREVIQLLDKSAYQLLEHQVELNRDGEIPPEIIGLEGRNIVWVIRVPGTKKHFRNSSYKVVKLTDDDAVIKKFKDNVVLMDSSHSEVPIVSSTSSGFQMDNTSSEANNSQHHLSSPVTPATKREREDMLQEERAEESSSKIDTMPQMGKRNKKLQTVKKENQYESKSRDTNRK